MVKDIENIAIIATPTSPLLPHLVNHLSHQKNLQVKILTRETPLTLPFTNTPEAQEPQNNSNHYHISNISHIQTRLTPTSLSPHLQTTQFLILLLTGPDIHLTLTLLPLFATLPNLEILLPSEYGLDSSNAAIRELLPSYQLRYKIQQELRKSESLNGKSRAVYAGVGLEEGLSSEGVLGVDCGWGSVVVFPSSGTKEKEMQVAISTFPDLARCIVEVATDSWPGGENEIYTCSAFATLSDLVGIIEEKLDKKFDRYGGDIEGAKTEAEKRFTMGFIDGGVALMGKVAVWDKHVKAWEGWKGVLGLEKEWKTVVEKAVDDVLKGSGSGGCGC